MTQVIYDMPFEEYLAIDALSSSAIKTINVSVSDYVEERKQNKSTPSQNLGRAYHKRILEGLMAFQESYTTPFDKSDFLCTVDDIKDFLVNNGCNFKGVKSKSEFESLARELGGALYSDAVAQETREIISQEIYDRINVFGQYLDSELLGYKTEVTVLWDWDGVPCKARFDAVNENGIIDLKTFSNPNKAMLDVLPSRIISKYRYDIQALFYIEAYRQAHEVDSFFNSATPDFRFFWVQSQGGYNVIITRLQERSEEFYLVNAYWQKALDDIQDARDIYQLHILDHPTGKIFLSNEITLEDHHFPAYHFHKEF